jgi:hypothetical protein
MRKVHAHVEKSTGKIGSWLVVGGNGDQVSNYPTIYAENKKKA